MAASLIGQLSVLSQTWSRLFNSKLRERCCNQCRAIVWKRECASAMLETETAGERVEKIEIPDKIERTPTSILEALASTVKNDINKPFYLALDDPAWVPQSDAQLKSHMAALDSGKQAARTMISMYPDYFTPFWDEAIPESMATTGPGYTHEGPNEIALLERIEKRKVTDAADMFKAIKSDGGTLSQDTLEKLLELLTVFNNINPKPADGLSNFIDPPFQAEAPFPVNLWREGNLSEEIFASLPEKSAKVHCLMIRGMAENYNKVGAYDMYKAARQLDLEVDVFTYNKLLGVASLDVETVDEIILFVQTILKDMADKDVRPNVQTFNSILKNCRRLSRWRGSKQFALSVLAEMKSCGIEPSLGTWCEAFSIFYYHKDKSSKTPEIFEEIFDSLKDKHLECTDEQDLTFFRSAMRVVACHFPDSRLALKVHDVLQFGNNNDLIGHRQLRFAYYKDLFLIVTPIEHTDVVMTLYDKLVPYIFMPHADVYVALFENIEVHDTYHYIPQLCADLEWSNLYIDQMAVHVVRAMAKQKQEDKLQSQFCEIVSSLLNRWKEERLKKIGIYLDGAIIGDMIHVYLNGDELEKAHEALQLYRGSRKLQRTEPSESSITRLVQSSIEAKDYSATKDLLTWMQDMGFGDINSLVHQTEEAFDLSERERNYLKMLAADADISSSSSDSD